MDYNKMTKEELIEYINSLNEEQGGKFGLVWDKEKEPEQIVVDCDKYIPILEEDKKKEIQKEGQNNILIEGDNFHSLSVLNYTHHASVDVIYIDPPYNTGNQDFMYNDKYIELEDGYRHSKWLNFMEKRLKIARQLLKNKGLIFISIDDNELFQLKLLCDKIFGELNFVNCVTVKSSETSGVKMSHVNKKLPKMKEYILIYKKSGDLELKPISISRISENSDFLNYSKYYSKIIKNIEDPVNKWEVVPIKDYCEELGIQIDSDERLLKFKLDNLDRIVYRTNNSSLAKLKFKTNTEEVISPSGIRYVWWEGKQMLFLRDYTDTYLGDLWTDISTINLNKEGNVDFKNGKKPIKLIKRILEMSNNKNAIVLDFFAGSGTTAEAVLRLNNEDGGKRRFILCTNNENNICSDITYPRIKNVINGYGKNKKCDVSLKYFKTKFVNNTGTRDQLYYDLTEKCIPLLCVKSDTYELIEKNKEYVIYSDKEKTNYSCVYFDIFGQSYDKFLNKIKEIKEHKNLYIFSLSEYINEDNFNGISNYSIEPIPYKILDLYKNVVKMSKEN